MRGARGGLRDQVKAFREFLLRRKKKKKLDAEKLRLKKKRDKEEKKKREVVLSPNEIFLNDIEFKIFNGDKFDFVYVHKQVDVMSKDQGNFPILDKIEEVKERLEVEIIFEEIIKPKTKSQVISSNVDNKRENAKIEKFISSCSKFVNQSDNPALVSHYFSLVDRLHSKHSVEQKIVTNNKLNEYVVKEEQLMLAIKEKDVLKKDDFRQDASVSIVQSEKVPDVSSEIQVVPLVSVLEKSNDEVKASDEIVEIMDVNDVSSISASDKEVSVSYDKDVSVSSDKDVSSDKEVDEIVHYVDSDEKFDSKDFDFINESIKRQIIDSEMEIAKVKRGIKDIKDIFKKKSGFERFIEFSSNLFNLGRGLINKHVFSNSLSKRLNSEILINNSLKGIHRAFVDEKQEVPYVVFESFMNEINDKKDCAIKINDICEDSLDEVRRLKADFISKYGSIADERVNGFIAKFDKIEGDLLVRQQEALQIEKQAMEQYKKNYQKVKVRK